MTLLEDARRLADANPYTLDRAACQFCYQVQDREHFPGCPWLALPKIVTALESASALVDGASLGEPLEEYGPDRIYVFCRGDGLHGTHRAGCRYQALVAVLRGEVVPSHKSNQDVLTGPRD